MGSEEKAGYVKELGKGQRRSWDMLSRACFPSLPAGEAGEWRPCQKECSLKWCAQQSLSGTEASTKFSHCH